MLYLDYNEKQMHGTKEFPIAFYHVDHNHPRYEMPFHWHKEYEIVKIIEGSFRLMLADSEIMAEYPKTVFMNALFSIWTSFFFIRMSADSISKR